MTITEKYFAILTIVLFLLINQIKIYAVDYEPDPNVMTKWGPKLSEEELAVIAKLSTPQLAEMLKNGDTLHAFAALNQLTINDGWKQNFDLLLSIASERRGDMIVEGLIWPRSTIIDAEYKRMVDKLLDFLESELKREKPSVSRKQAIRSIAQTVDLNAAVKDKFRPIHLDPNTDPNQLPVPYGNERVVNILTKCLDSNDMNVRLEVVDWLGNIGANDRSKSGEIIANLEAQIAKEQMLNESEDAKEKAKKIIKCSLETIRKDLDRYKRRPRTRLIKPIDSDVNSN